MAKHGVSRTLTWQLGVIHQNHDLSNLVCIASTWALYGPSVSKMGPILVGYPCSQYSPTIVIAAATELFLTKLTIAIACTSFAGTIFVVEE